MSYTRPTGDSEPLFSWFSRMTATFVGCVCAGIVCMLIAREALKHEARNLGKEIDRAIMKDK